MAKTVLKYQVDRYGVSSHYMPRDREFCAVKLQHGEPHAWFVVNTDSPEEYVNIFIAGTGHLVPDSAVFLGTFFEDAFVWHLFEEHP